MRNVILGCGVATCAVMSLANTQIIQVQPTNTQAIVWVRTDQAGNCTYRISTSTAFSPLINDVNTTLFSGANSDARSGSLVNGKDHYFVAGARNSALASDGKLYSRALAAETLYYGGATCGGDAEVDFQFVTANLALGNTYTEQPPFHPNGFGNWGWPTVSWTDPTRIYVDPMTGVSIKRVTAPGWYGQQRGPVNFDASTGGAGWTNAVNILTGAGCTGTTATCAQTGNTNKIFVAMFGNNFTNGQPVIQQSAGYSTSDTYDDFLVMLSGVCSSSTTADCQVNICLPYFDSQTCNTATQTVTLSTTAGTVGFPAPGINQSGGVNQWSPQFQFGEWGGTAPLRGDFAASWGTVKTSGAAVTLNGTGNSYNYFNVKWRAGALIYIQGSGCVSGGTDICTLAASPATTQSLTVTETMNTLISANYRSMASGALIWKTTTNGTVTIGANYAYAYSALFQVFSEGDMRPCNPVSITVSFAADGATAITPVAGNFCFLPLQSANNRSSAGGALFLLIPLTGEVRLISMLFTPPGVNSGDATADQNTGGIAFPIAPWDSVSGLTIYGSGATPGGTISIFQGTYDTTKNFKAYAHPLWTCGTCFIGGTAAPGQDPTIAYPGGRWSDDPISYVNVTKPSQGKDLVSQIANTNPQYDAQIFLCSGLDRTVGGFAVAPCGVGQQDGFTLINGFNLSTGTLTSVGDSFSTWPGRMCGVHSSFISSVSPGYYALSCNPPTGASGFQVGINTSIAANISAGAQTVTPGSMSGIAVNRLLWIGTGGSQEQVAVTGVTASTFTATFANSHTGSSAVTGASTPMYSPYQVTAAEMWKSGGFSTDTSMTTSSPLDNCSLYSVPTFIQALGGTGNRCVKIRMPNVCSHFPSTVHELAKWPCPQNAHWSQPFTLTAGDQLLINSGGGESDLVASVTSVTDSVCGTQCLEVVLVRVIFPTATISNGWTAYMVPPLTQGSPGGYTPGAGIWAQLGSANLNTTWLSDPQAFAGHADPGTAPTAGNVSFVRSSIFGVPYHVRFNLPLANQAGNFNNANLIRSDGAFNGLTPSTTYQSYPSNEQYNAATNERRWFLDFHHMNGSVGSTSVETPAAVDAVSYSAVAGTQNVYQFSAIAGGISVSQINYKTRALQGYAGRYLLRDVSSAATGNLITDTTPFQICVALNPNECRTGASSGNVFVSVPNVAFVGGNCYTDWITENLPCAFYPATNAAWMAQMDGTESYGNFEFGRRLSMGLTGYGRQYQFNTLIAESTGTWGMFKADWADGIRSEVFMAKLPSFPPFNSVARNAFVNIPVQFGSGSAFAEVQFGYAENGFATGGIPYCTARQDLCNTSSAPGTPFNFESDVRTLATCTNGCTIQIPGASQRVLYYWMRRSTDGVNWINGSLGAIAVP